MVFAPVSPFSPVQSITGVRFRPVSSGLESSVSSAFVRFRPVFLAYLEGGGGKGGRNLDCRARDYNEFRVPGSWFRVEKVRNAECEMRNLGHHKVGSPLGPEN